MGRSKEQVRTDSKGLSMYNCPGCRSGNVFLISLDAREGGRSQISKYKCLDCKTKWEIRG